MVKAKKTPLIAIETAFFVNLYFIIKYKMRFVLFDLMKLLHIDEKKLKIWPEFVKMNTSKEEQSGSSKTSTI